MEEKLMKLMAQLSVIAVMIWVLAAVLGRRQEATVQGQAKPRCRHSKGAMWATSGVIGEYAQSADYNPPPLAPDIR